MGAGRLRSFRPSSRQSQTVPGQSDRFRQGGFNLPVVHPAGKVGQPGLARVQFQRQRDRLVRTEMGGVRVRLEPVEHEQVHITDGFKSLLGKSLGVRDVGESTDTFVFVLEEESDSVDLSVLNGKRRHRGFPEMEGAGDDMRLWFQVADVAILTVEGVVKGGLDSVEAGGAGVDRQFGICSDGEPAQLVETHDVVRMLVGEKRGIEVGNALPQALHAEIGPRIDDEGQTIGGGDVNGAAGSLVFRVVGSADRAIAADHRHADGSPGAQESDFKVGGHVLLQGRRGVLHKLSFRSPQMLAVLKIKNLALVDDLTWELGPGLVGVTGQTGAGKSMIVGALKLILGERANHDLIRNGESSCAVEAIFELGGNLDRVNELLDDAGLEPCDGNTLVVKRVFGGTKGNKQFVNCSPCTLAMLKTIGDHLVDLHGPHEHQSLLSQDRQLAMLDAYAQAARERADYSAAWQNYREAIDNLEEFRGLRQATDSEIELLRYQVEEIEEAELDPVQETELEQRYTLARNSARLVEFAGDAARDLGAAVEQLGDVRRALTELNRLDPAAADLTEGFEGAQVELEEMDRGLRDYLSGLEFDSSEVEEMERRIDLVESLKRKYGESLEDVVAYGLQARERLERIDQREEELVRLESEVQAARSALDKIGAKLSRKRREAAPKLAREIGGHLEDLGFKQSHFDVPLAEADEPHSRGFETVDFQFAPNPGEPAKPLRIVASSGEMSRVMLAVKSALADQDQIPLMVFDEIDANVGGEIAHAVGKKMSGLGDRHQVVAITHMPQVAALAHHHYLVSKEFGDDSTQSYLRSVEGKDRVRELARMLGGVGDEALALAESLLARPS